MDAIQFKQGDVVFVARAHFRPIERICPDCLGRKVWAVKLPNGEAWDVDCPRCHQGGYGGRSSGVVREEHAWTADCQKGTINGVRFDSTAKEGQQVSYTLDGSYTVGVGGTIQYAGDVFATAGEAVAEAERRAERARIAHDEVEAQRAARKRKPKAAYPGCAPGAPDKAHDELRSVAYARSQVRAARKEVARWIDYAARHGAVIS